MTINWTRAAEFVRRRQAFALVAGAAIWGLWVVSVALGGNGTWDLAGQVVCTDHVAFYSAASLINAGRGAEIYDPVAVGAFEADLFPERVFGGKLLWARNPPFLAWLYTPLAPFGYAVSAWVAAAVSLACFGVAIRLLAPRDRLRTALWSLTFLPCFAVVSYGQTGFLTLAGFAASYRLLAAGHRFWGGFAAGVLWLKPPLLTGLLAWWLLDVRRFWPALVGVTVAGAAWVAGTWPFLETEWRAFAGSLTANAGFENFDWWKAHSARAFWRLLLTPGLAPLPAVLWGVSVLVGVGWLAANLRHCRDDVPAAFALSTLLMLWASPHVMVYEWAAALVPAGLFWFHRPEERDRWRVVVAAVWVAMFVSGDFTRLQLHLWQLAGVESGPVVQLSILVLAWAMFQAGRVARKS